MDLSALDFIVVNMRTGNACAAFMLPRDALHYIKWRRESEGPHGPLYGLANANGTLISTHLAAQAVSHYATHFPHLGAKS